LYDALGRRLGKRAGNTATTFVHDGAQVLVEYEAPLLTSTTLGTPASAGSFVHNSNGTATLVAGGTGITGTADQGRYAYGVLYGNGSITVKVATQSNSNAWARAGVMLRDGTAANAAYVGLFVTPSNGVHFQTRTSAGDTTTSTSLVGVTAPEWLSPDQRT
jgi:hypothetical protein